MKSIILESISDVADENQILECVANKTNETAIENLTECIQNDLISSINYTGFEYNIIFEGDPTKLMEYLQIIERYLNTFTKILSNCEKIAQQLKKNLITNLKFMETVLDFPKNLRNIVTSTNTSVRTNWCIIKSDLAQKLFSFTFDLYKVSVFVDEMRKSQENDERVKTLYDRCVSSKLIQILTSKSVSNCNYLN